MCCIFTCLGWMIDLIQRVWTFAMSCCISSAICCVMMTSSLSGIALGYNYSLAEYIDLKETNVSVYLKRGIFDDEITDEMEWRRSGNDLLTGSPAEGESVPPQSGRRLDDSVFDSGNKFEGGLMKLTAKPLHEPITKTTPFTPEADMNELHTNNYNQLDEMKAIQGILNKRRFNAVAATSTTVLARRMMAKDPRGPGGPEILESAIYPLPKEEQERVHTELLSGRRFNPYDPKIYQILNPARTAVPDTNIGDAVHWTTVNPYFPTSSTPLFMYNEIYPLEKPGLPKPIPLNVDRFPIPTPQSSGRRQFSEPGLVVFTEGRRANAAKDRDATVKSRDEIGESMRQELSRHRSEDYTQNKDDDYEVDPRGLPVRKKRHIKSDLIALITSPSPSPSIHDLSLSPEVFSAKTKPPALLGKLMSTLMQ